MLHDRVARPIRLSSLVPVPIALTRVIQGAIVNATLQAADESSVRHLLRLV
ncbi:MAG TPA: hypothetical protein VKY90_17805 [Candidatus Dormibacteraeota bacterium]|nr:hypothetical protein [Candidatus Dormibacteraeota bacterium]